MSTDTGDLRGAEWPWERDEHRDVVAWRRQRLVASGFPPGAAELIASRSDVDLHALLDLVDRGCPPRLAARIVAPIDLCEIWP